MQAIIGFTPKEIDMTSFTPTATFPDAIEGLRTQYPAAYQELEAAGYEFAGADVLGRCSGVATLFLGLEPQSGRVRGWVYDVTTQEFIGPCFAVYGPQGAAALQAREMTESRYAEDQLSGTATRAGQQALQEVCIC